MKEGKEAHFSEEKKKEKSPFPHRALRKDFLAITVANKAIPVHKLAIKLGYKGKPMEKYVFEHWAYVPFKPGRDPYRDGLGLSSQLIRMQKPPQGQKQESRSKNTSEIALKQYLRRKQRSLEKQSPFYSRIVDLQEKQKRLLQGQDNHFHCLTQQAKPENEQTLAQNRFKTNWKVYLQKTNELRQSKCQDSFFLPHKNNAVGQSLKQQQLSEMARLQKSKILKSKLPPKRLRYGQPRWADNVY